MKIDAMKIDAKKVDVVFFLAFVKGRRRRRI